MDVVVVPVEHGDWAFLPELYAMADIDVDILAPLGMHSGKLDKNIFGNASVRHCLYPRS
jgi:hypothetical protein